MRIEWRTLACHPERQRRISRDGQQDPLLALRMTPGTIRLFSSDELIEHYVGINALQLPPLHQRQLAPVSWWNHS
jgi:hypothetical protein